ncbi:hypothetical protein [Kistimonas asteriae]|uniref:hypothetical protein n=1 Tax=Kistimonas asteriae TaxID=517724 RepID=UPI001BAD58CB|nr:hypothetical protein [Kistimonas asteriae]
MEAAKCVHSPPGSSVNSDKSSKQPFQTSAKVQTEPKKAADVPIRERCIQLAELTALVTVGLLAGTASILVGIIASTGLLIFYTMLPAALVCGLICCSAGGAAAECVLLWPPLWLTGCIVAGAVTGLGYSFYQGVMLGINLYDRVEALRNPNQARHEWINSLLSKIDSRISRNNARLTDCSTDEDCMELGQDIAKLQNIFLNPLIPFRNSPHEMANKAVSVEDPPLKKTGRTKLNAPEGLLDLRTTV